MADEASDPPVADEAAASSEGAAAEPKAASAPPAEAAAAAEPAATAATDGPPADDIAAEKAAAAAGSSGGDAAADASAGEEADQPEAELSFKASEPTSPPARSEGRTSFADGSTPGRALELTPEQMMRMSSARKSSTHFVDLDGEIPPPPHRSQAKKSTACALL